jgi:ergothioneine biosynthesis protein EgtB
LSDEKMGERRELTVSSESLLRRYHRVRSETEALASPITAEDAQVQSMPDASPTKWHLGHTTWFFETFVLSQAPDARPHREEFKVLFNSYYNAVGAQHPRPRRGMITRPALDEVYDYRHAVDARVRRYLERADERELETIAGIVALGCHHEQQHQELMLTDILHLFSENPLRPSYRSDPAPLAEPSRPMVWHGFSEGIVWIGHEGGAFSFSFDNETPRHRTFVHGFEIGSRLVTAREYMEFMSEGGYQRPDLWLSDGFAMVQQAGWIAPSYWERRQGTWWQMTLHGMRPIDPNAPVCHVSYYEADAYARYRGARLPTEAEWEVAVSRIPIDGNLQESGLLAPLAPGSSAGASDPPSQMYGDLWEWTMSAYLPYHGYRPGPGALGEYNGKFMSGQMVLRGGSFATPADHIRPSYRNFFPPHARWQFTGIRLARDARG